MSVHRLAPNLYRVRLRANPRPDGKRPAISRTFHGTEAEAKRDALRARYTHRWTQAVEGVETEFEVELVPKPELEQAEAELTRAWAVVVLLKSAASNVLSRGRRFPPRAEWRELHTAVRGARAWLAERGAP